MRFVRILIFLLFVIRLTSFFVFQPKLKTGDIVRFSGVIFEPPILQNSFVKFRLNDYQVLAPQKNFSQLLGFDGMGKRVEVIGRVEKNQNSKIKNQNDNKKLKNTYIRENLLSISVNPIFSNEYIIQARSIKIYDNSIQESVSQFFFRLRQNCKNVFQKLLPAAEAGLMSGIVLGDQNALSYDLKQKLIASGTIHVAAASGANLTIFAGTLAVILNIFFNLKTANLLNLPIIFGYSALAGFSPSIVRAAFMFLSTKVASFCGRPIKASYSLFLTCLIIIFLNPEIIFDVGFQLSVAATCGLIFSSWVMGAFFRAIDPIRGNPSESQDQGTIKDQESFYSIKTRQIRVNPFLSGIVKSTLPTLSCFIFTAPVIFFHFSRVSLFSLPANFAVLWIIEILMGTGGAILALNVIFPPLAKYLAFLTYPLLKEFINVISFFAK